jgi:hypothetical protein
VDIEAVIGFPGFAVNCFMDIRISWENTGGRDINRGMDE